MKRRNMKPAGRLCSRIWGRDDQANQLYDCVTVWTMKESMMSMLFLMHLKNDVRTTILESQGISEVISLDI